VQAFSRQIGRSAVAQWQSLCRLLLCERTFTAVLSRSERRLSGPRTAKVTAIGRWPARLGLSADSAWNWQSWLRRIEYCLRCDSQQATGRSRNAWGKDGVAEGAAGAMMWRMGGRFVLRICLAVLRSVVSAAAGVVWILGRRRIRAIQMFMQRRCKCRR